MRCKQDKLAALTNSKEGNWWYRTDITDLYDVFEPTYLRFALEKFPYLGHLIFGKAEWIQMGGELGDGLDSLSKYCEPVRPRVRPKGWKREQTRIIYIVCLLTQYFQSRNNRHTFARVFTHPNYLSI
jgi:hypothetical protein